MRGIIHIYNEVWTKIFEMVSDIDLGEPLTPEILSNSDHIFVKTLIYIYSMQSFIF